MSNVTPNILPIDIDRQADPRPKQSPARNDDPARFERHLDQARSEEPQSTYEPDRGRDVAADPEKRTTDEPARNIRPGEPQAGDAETGDTDIATRPAADDEHELPSGKSAEHERPAPERGPATTTVQTTAVLAANMPPVHETETAATPANRTPAEQPRAVLTQTVPQAAPLATTNVIEPVDNVASFPDTETEPQIGVTHISGAETDEVGAATPETGVLRRPTLPYPAMKGITRAVANLPEHYSGQGRPGELSLAVETGDQPVAAPAPMADAAPDAVRADDAAAPADGEPLPIPGELIADAAVLPDLVIGQPDETHTGPLIRATLGDEAPLPFPLDAEPDSGIRVATTPQTGHALGAPQTTLPAETSETPLASLPTDAPDAPRPLQTAPAATVPAHAPADPQPLQPAAPASDPNRSAEPAVTPAPAQPNAPTAQATNESPSGQAKPLATPAETATRAITPASATQPAPNPAPPVTAQSRAPAALGTGTPQPTPFLSDEPTAKPGMGFQRVTPNGMPDQVNEAVRPANATSATLPPAALSALGDPVTPVTPSTATPVGDPLTATLPLPQNAHTVSVQFGTAPQLGGVQTPVNTIAFNIARNFDNGITRFQLRIDPPELGRVDVKLDMSVEGRVQAHLTVERSETLDLMMRDARSLERALADAGLSMNKDSLTFSLKDQNAFDAKGEQADDGSAADQAADDTLEDQPQHIAQGYISDTGVDISV